MEERLRSCLNNTHSTEYIFPFFWQHGEDHAVLLEELEAIAGCGLTQFCAESRPHENFCREQWWDDLGFLLAEAKKRNMKVWVLDDKRFPTGYANNYIESHPELRAVRLRIEFRDFIGPQKDIAIIPVSLDEEESFVTIVAYPRKSSGDLVGSEGINLTGMIKDGLIWWDIPEGSWRVYYVIRTRNSPVEGKKNYIDMLSYESCNAMIQAVYEPHYCHFKEYFGNTLVGFFSDEPGFANEVGHYDSTLGREEAYLPWNDELVGSICERIGLDEDKVIGLLPSLWHEVQRYSPAIREAYMDAVTKAYSKNFSQQLGDWCREHGVLYSGHVIEDQNAHQRLGHGAGHFFCSMDGQDYAGCDIVLHQMIPGMMEMDHIACLEGKRADPEFFRYTLPKLTSSHAHINPLMKGRSVCEIFGGFGWAEGIWQMKQMTDLMLVGGINHFVPHAFDPKFPDWDHPPHFYAGGRNVQYPVFKQLMDYMQRMCHLLSGGVHKADVAVYYNAEAEWAGGKSMLQQKVCKHLCQRQIDFDLLPQDTICNDAKTKDGKLVVREEEYAALIVPYSQYLPNELIDRFVDLAGQGVSVWFVDGYPDATTSGGTVASLRSVCRCVKLDQLADSLIANHTYSVKLRDPYPYLRTIRIDRDGYAYLMLWNEDIFSQIDTYLTLPLPGEAAIYDAWNNRLYASYQQGNQVRIRLAPAQSIVLCIGRMEKDLPAYDYGDGKFNELNLSWQVFVKPHFEDSYVSLPMDGLENVAGKLPFFNGIIRYDAQWNVEDTDSIKILAFDRISEPARLWINGEYCQTVISAPYRFDISNKLKPGKNHLRIEIYSNLAYQERDFLSTFLPLQPVGIIGKVYTNNRN